MTFDQCLRQSWISGDRAFSGFQDWITLGQIVGVNVAWTADQEVVIVLATRVPPIMMKTSDCLGAIAVDSLLSAMLWHVQYSVRPGS
jgi:hypothetical protein